MVGASMAGNASNGKEEGEEVRLRPSRGTDTSCKRSGDDEGKGEGEGEKARRGGGNLWWIGRGLHG